ncbi:hypothetical protein P4S72_26595 [Vibrio sp. PP-XX7]
MMFRLDLAQKRQAWLDEQQASLISALEKAVTANGTAVQVLANIGGLKMWTQH